MDYYGSFCACWYNDSRGKKFIKWIRRTFHLCTHEFKLYDYSFETWLHTMEPLHPFIKVSKFDSLKVCSRCGKIVPLIECGEGENGELEVIHGE